MLYNELAISYKLVSSGSYAANYTDLEDPQAVNLIHGLIPSRPLKGAAGLFSNESIQRLDIKLEAGTDDDFEAVAKGDFVKIKTDDNVTVTEQEYVVSANVDVLEDGETYKVISLSPATKALSGSDAVVELSLHEEA